MDRRIFIQNTGLSALGVSLSPHLLANQSLMPKSENLPFSGIQIASREYHEMLLPSLKAFGDAVREVKKH